MPPNNDPKITSYWNRYPTPDELPATQFWVDSPLEQMRVAPKQRQDSKNVDDVSHPLNNPPQNGKAKAPLPVRTQSNGKTNDKNQELRFFNVTDPKELKDRSQLRLNRQHVMHTYLDKERLKPSGQRDVRVDGAGAAIKRKHSRIQMPAPFGSTLTAEGPLGRKDLPTPESSCASDREADHRDTTTTKAKTSEQKRARKPTHTYSHTSSQLVTGINGTWPNSSYIQTAWQDVPWQSLPSSNPEPTATIGGALNPFDTWPTFSESDINVINLKWSCSRRFGSTGIALHWVPELLRARHAFLSTICISSAHDDIMARAHKTDPPHWLATQEGLERIRVRGEIIRMVNQSLNDEEMRLSDATIIAVLHLLNSEIMGCDDRVMKTHQDGLHRMVRQRGGLEGLGVKGQLARILTITMYIISVLRESPPHGEFVAYATKHAAPIPSDTRNLPESPVYCRPEGYRTITRANCTSDHTWDLLNKLRDFTKCFFELHRRKQSPQASGSATIRLKDLYNHISSLPPSSSPTLAFPDLNARNTYEALRLTAILYTHAIYHRLPFSIASAHLSTNTPLPLRIRTALLGTDCSSCWGPLAGVLFWIALIAGAAANPGTELWNEEREGKDEEGRKVLAAIAVRCSIVLSFELGEAVLETLRRLVAIGALLAEKSTDPEDLSGMKQTNGADGSGYGAGAVPETWTQNLWTSEPGVGTFVNGQEVFGPEVPPVQQQSLGLQGESWTQMGDFAREFEGLY